MDNLELKTILVNLTKENESITEAMIDNVIALNDINLLIEEAKALFSFEIWDKVSSVNGTSAELVKKQLPFTLPNWNGISYFVKAENVIRYFETTDWEKSGWTPILTQERALELGEKQILNLATDGAIYVMLTKLSGE